MSFGREQVRGDLPAGVEDLLAVLVQVAGAADGVAEEVAGGSAPGFDLEGVGFEVGEEFLGAGGAGDGGADAVLEPFATGLFPTEAGGFVHLALGGPPGCGAVALAQAAQAVVLLDLTARITDADAAVVEFGAAAVFADGGGEDMDVIVRVADGDPAASQVVAVGGDAGGLDDALRDLAPFGVGQVPVFGGRRAPRSARRGR